MSKHQVDTTQTHHVVFIMLRLHSVRATVNGLSQRHPFLLFISTESNHVDMTIISSNYAF